MLELGSQRSFCGKDFACILSEVGEAREALADVTQVDNAAEFPSTALRPLSMLESRAYGLQSASEGRG